jgi:hypothetical protein
MKRFVAIACIAASMVATSAHADWQYTKWGMSAEQVAKLSKGAVVTGPGAPGDHVDGETVGATGTYASGEYQFQATFYFVEDKLADVRLKLKDNDGYALKNALNGLYGKPFDETADSILNIVTYHDKVKNNRIDLIMIGKDSTTLEYRPLTDESSNGL